MLSMVVAEEKIRCSPHSQRRLQTWPGSKVKGHVAVAQLLIGNLGLMEGYNH